MLGMLGCTERLRVLEQDPQFVDASSHDAQSPADAPEPAVDSNSTWQVAPYEVCVLPQIVVVEVLDEYVPRRDVALVGVFRGARVHATSRTGMQSAGWPGVEPSSGSGVEAATWTGGQASTWTDVEASARTDVEASARADVEASAGPYVGASARADIETPPPGPT